ncbi:hypothetical protein [Serratia fonticola]|uniref:hypothetical protein n=1 Tax=Serratia fonticola TaxID=47917 RepID=UPI00093B5735|nr:hypothetical protein [Serratia fonticola]OKP26581.1 hypothetical protein BSQ40_18715 [Serratia fonticola]
MKSHILKIIYTAIELENNSLAHPIDLATGEETALYGLKGSLDSISLVSIVVDVEAMLEKQLGISLILVNDSAMSAANSPFSTVGSFANYIIKRCSEVNHAI